MPKREASDPTRAKRWPTIMPPPAWVVRVAVVLCFCAAEARAVVDLVWSPSVQTSPDGSVLSIALFVHSDQPGGEGILALDVLLDWDPCRLELLGLTDNGPYDWLSAGFPNDSQLDGLNAPFTGPSPFVPANDGAVFFQAAAQFPPSAPAVATPAGLKVITFRFRALGAGGATQLELVESLGQFSRSRVLSSIVPGQEITGALGDPAVVLVSSAPNAWVQAVGPRYLKVTPLASAPCVALFVTGDGCDAAVSCVAGYVQADGRLGPASFCQSAAQWGDVFVRGTSLIPGKRYVVRAECEPPGVDGCGDAASAVTYRWGDTNNSGFVDIDDILCVVRAFGADYSTCSREAGDLMSCLPNRTVDLDDLLNVLYAFQGLAMPCVGPCSP